MNYQGRISIDGKLFDYTLTPVDGDQAAVPPPGQGFAIPPSSPPFRQQGDGEIVTVQLLGHEMKTGISKSGKNEGKTWEKHNFRASDNKTYCTFKSETVAKLSPLVNEGTPVKMRVRANDFKGFDIIAVIGT